MPRQKRSRSNAGRVKLRKKKLKGGGHSLFLDTYRGPKASDREYEFLGLYLTGDKASDQETWALAQSIRARRETEYHAGRTGGTVRHRSRMSFLDAYTQFAELRRRGSSRRATFESTLSHIRDWDRVGVNLGDIDAEWLNDLQRFLLGRRKRKERGKEQDECGRLSVTSVWNYYQTIVSCLHYAIRQRWITEDPMLRAERIIVVSAAQRTFLTIEEVRRLAAMECPRFPEIKRAFMFSCATGIRLSDLEQLRWVDVAEGRITKRTQKTGEPIYLPLSTQALEILSTQVEQERWHLAPERDRDLVFYLPSRGTIQTVVPEWAASAGIRKRVTFHVARHTFATLALAHGAELLAVSKYLGHSTVQTTQIYAHIVDEAKKKAADAIPSFDQGEGKP